MGTPVLDIDHEKASAIVFSGTATYVDKVARAIADERERCAQVAEHLNGWGSKKVRESGIAEHIAKIIREG